MPDHTLTFRISSCLSKAIILLQMGFTIGAMYVFMELILKDVSFQFLRAGRSSHGWKISRGSPGRGRRGFNHSSQSFQRQSSYNVDSRPENYTGLLGFIDCIL